MSALPFISNHLFVAAIGQKGRTQPGHPVNPPRSVLGDAAFEPPLDLVDSDHKPLERELRPVAVAVEADRF